MRYSYLVLIVCWLYACESDLSISIPYDTKPVLSTLMNKDSTIFVRVTLSARVNTHVGAYPEPDAVVQLYEDGQFKETLVRKLELSGYFYSSVTKVQLGHTYRVTAAIPGYETAEGTDVIPDTVAVGEMKRMEITSSDPFRVEHKMVVQLKDKAGEKNYYRIRILSGSYIPVGPGWSLVLTYSGESMYFKLDELDLNPFGSKERNDFFVDDALFDGKEPFFRFSLVHTFPTEAGQVFLMEVSNLTYDTYRYLQTAHEAEVKRGDPLVEKILVHNNIKNGFGIVGGAGIRVYELQK